MLKIFQPFVTTVGYGDITPANYFECLFLIFILLISSSVYAFLINSIGNIMENIKMQEKLRLEDRDILSEYM